MAISPDQGCQKFTEIPGGIETGKSPESPEGSIVAGILIGCDVGSTELTVGVTTAGTELQEIIKIEPNKIEEIF
ncbi:MAG TPA: hypothetical protein VMW28_07725 [Pelolinea sp.]|nr:hypothetical protein [Pelolinea sp.]